MKRAVILHGTDGSPDINWIPWAKSQLELRGYDVYVPQLPECHTPNRFTYDEFLRRSGWDFRDNLLIGHSSGATAMLNLLSADWFPAVDTVILVGTFLNEDKVSGVEWYESGQFDQLFPESFDVDKIRSKAREFVLIHGTDDPYCGYDTAEDFCRQLDGVFVPVEGGRHLSGDRKELPEVLPFIEGRSMTTYILAGGCDGDYPEYIVQLARVVRMKMADPKILSCGFSSEDVQAEASFPKRKKMFEAGFGESVEIVMATKDTFIEQVRAADVVYLHGGSTNILVDAMREYPNIQEEFAGKIIIGSSAGANYLSSCGFSPSANAVGQSGGIVDVAVVVHYGSTGFSGKTFTPEYWQKAAEAVRDGSGKREVILLPEGTFAVIEQG